MSVSQKLRPLGSGQTDKQTDRQTYGYPYGQIHNSQIATRTYGARRGLKVAPSVRQKVSFFLPKALRALDKSIFMAIGQLLEKCQFCPIFAKMGTPKMGNVIFNDKNMFSIQK